MKQFSFEKVNLLRQRHPITRTIMDFFLKMAQRRFFTVDMLLFVCEVDKNSMFLNQS